MDLLSQNAAVADINSIDFRNVMKRQNRRRRIFAPCINPVNCLKSASKVESV